MSDLTEALDNIREVEEGEEFYNRVGNSSCWVVGSPVLDAARKYADLTSPETIEKVARSIYGSNLPTPSYDRRGRMVSFEAGGSTRQFRRAAEAVLRAVTEDTR